MAEYAGNPKSEHVKHCLDKVTSLLVQYGFTPKGGMAGVELMLSVLVASNLAILESLTEIQSAIRSPFVESDVPS